MIAAQKISPVSYFRPLEFIYCAMCVNNRVNNMLSFLSSFSISLSFSDSLTSIDARIFIKQLLVDLSIRMIILKENHAKVEL